MSCSASSSELKIHVKNPLPAVEVKRACLHAVLPVERINSDSDMRTTPPRHEMHARLLIRLARPIITKVHFGWALLNMNECLGPRSGYLELDSNAWQNSPTKKRLPETHPSLPR